MPQTKEQKRVNALVSRMKEIRALEQYTMRVDSLAASARLASKRREAENIKAKLTDRGRRLFWAETGESA